MHTQDGDYCRSGKSENLNISTSLPIKFRKGREIKEVWKAKEPSELLVPWFALYDFFFLDLVYVLIA